jgi:hypothetical protein
LLGQHVTAPSSFGTSLPASRWQSRSQEVRKWLARPNVPEEPEQSQPLVWWDREDYYLWRQEAEQVMAGAKEPESKQ